MLLIVFALGQLATEIKPAHRANPVFQAVIDPRQSIHLPAPTLGDGMTADDESKALIARVGSATRLEEMLKDSISSPVDIKLSDVRKGDAEIVRTATICFALHADEGQIETEELRQIRDRKRVEAANLRFESRELPAEALQARTIDRAIGNDGKPVEWYLHMEGRLLDRITVEATNRVFATFSDRSVVFASRTVAAFERDPEFPNQWSKLEGRKSGASQPFAGGISFVKVSKLAMRPGVLLVEASFAFSEPIGWFGGEPVLRSKIGLAAQDQVRGLRRELADRKKRQTGKP